MLDNHPSEIDRIDRAQIAEILGCSREAVRLMDERGELPSRARDERGRYHYAREDVERLAARRRGEGVGEGTLTGATCAAVFALFDKDWTFSEVVQKTLLLPSTVRRMHTEWEQGYAQEHPAATRDREEQRVREAFARKMREEDLYLRNVQVQQDDMLIMAGKIPPRGARPKAARSTTAIDPLSSRGAEASSAASTTEPAEYVDAMAELERAQKRFEQDKERGDKILADAQARIARTNELHEQLRRAQLTKDAATTPAGVRGDGT
jgi:hypothetical protein